MDTYGRHPYGNYPSTLQPNSASRPASSPCEARARDRESLDSVHSREGRNFWDEATWQTEESPLSCLDRWSMWMEYGKRVASGLFRLHGHLFCPTVRPTNLHPNLLIIRTIGLRVKYLHRALLSFLNVSLEAAKQWVLQNSREK